MRTSSNPASRSELAIRSAPRQEHDPVQAGDQVFGICDGAFAEYACGKAKQFALKPANLSFEEAAAVPISALTALHGLREASQLKAGQKVLVIGASGGVGTYAVQLEKVEAVAALMRAGAPIGELNALRKHLSLLKGGRLAAQLAPADVRVLVLSDVPGDDLSTIASGPFAPDPTTFADALRSVTARGASVPAAVRARLSAGTRGELEETPKPGDARFAHVSHRILAGPVDLARAAAEFARGRGFDAEAEPAPLSGDVATVAARSGPAAVAIGAAIPREETGTHLCDLVVVAVE